MIVFLKMAPKSERFPCTFAIVLLQMIHRVLATYNKNWKKYNFAVIVVDLPDHP